MARKKHIDASRRAERGRARSRRPSSAGERAWQAALRPRTFDEYIGQRELIENLRDLGARARKQSGWALDHFLFAGPPGLGKTTLAHVIANELGVNLHVTLGPGDRSQGHARVAAHRRSASATRCSSTRSTG